MTDAAQDAARLARLAAWRTAHLTRSARGDQAGYDAELRAALVTFVRGRKLAGWRITVAEMPLEEAEGPALALQVAQLETLDVLARPARMRLAVHAPARARSVLLDLECGSSVRTLGWDLDAAGRPVRAYEARLDLGGGPVTLRLAGLAHDRRGDPVAALLVPCR